MKERRKRGMEKKREKRGASEGEREGGMERGGGMKHTEREETDTNHINVIETRKKIEAGFPVQKSEFHTKATSSSHYLSRAIAFSILLMSTVVFAIIIVLHIY